MKKIVNIQDKRMFYVNCEENMVVTYLEKNRAKLQEQRININSQLTAAKNQYIENVEFIKVLEENNDPSFESFTPRQVNGFNKRKTEELKELQKEISSRINGLNEELTLVDEELAELGEVIRVAKENKKKLECIL